MLRILALAGLLTFGAAFATDGSRQYDVVISGRFEPDERMALGVALGEWRAAVPSLRLRVMGEGTACEPLVYHPHPLICIAPASLESVAMTVGVPLDDGSEYVGVTTRYVPVEASEPEAAWADVHVATQALSGDAQVKVFAHELGHAMGLRHTRVRGALMYPDVQGQSAGPTRLDVRAWYAVRR